MRNSIFRLKQKIYHLLPNIYEIFSGNSIFKYTFANRPYNSFLHASHKISNPIYIFLGKDVTLEKDIWINVIKKGKKHGVVIIKNGVKIGERCSLSSYHNITIEKDVLIGLNVYIADHEHIYEDVQKPIMYQGVTEGGGVHIKKDAWIGNNVVLFSKNHIVIGEHSVIGANSVVKNSIPDFSVAVGNPAVVIKKYNKLKKRWMKI